MFRRTSVQSHKSRGIVVKGTREVSVRKCKVCCAQECLFQICSVVTNGLIIQIAYLQSPIKVVLGPRPSSIFGSIFSPPQTKIVDRFLLEYSVL